jgi:hypothetical protein
LFAVHFPPSDSILRMPPTTAASPSTNFLHMVLQHQMMQGKIILFLISDPFNSYLRGEAGSLAYAWIYMFVHQILKLTQMETSGSISFLCPSTSVRGHYAIAPYVRRSSSSGVVHFLFSHNNWSTISLEIFVMVPLESRCRHSFPSINLRMQAPIHLKFLWWGLD